MDFKFQSKKLPGFFYFLLLSVILIGECADQELVAPFRDSPIKLRFLAAKHSGAENIHLSRLSLCFTVYEFIEQSLVVIVHVCSQHLKFEIIFALQKKYVGVQSTVKGISLSLRLLLFKKFLRFLISDSFSASCLPFSLRHRQFTGKSRVSHVDLQNIYTEQRE